MAPYRSYQSCPVSAVDDRDDYSREVSVQDEVAHDETTPLSSRRRRPSSTSPRGMLWVIGGLCLSSMLGFCGLLLFGGPHASHSSLFSFLGGKDPRGLSAQSLANSVRENLLETTPSNDDDDKQNPSDATLGAAFTHFYHPPQYKAPKKKEEEEEEHDHAPDGCEATIMIVRHCEKGHVREHCDYNGFERSVYLATLFGDDDERWPAPSYIFVERPDGRSNHNKLNFREAETLGPLAAKAHVLLDYSYSDASLKTMTKNLVQTLQSGALCGKLTVIAWKHSSIGHLAHHLGCGPAEGCPIDYKGSKFDEIWEIKFVYRQFDHSTKHSLRLPTHPEWRVYGSIQDERFDPLSFSKSVGDYPPYGTETSMRWGPATYSVPERTKFKDKRGWTHETKQVPETPAAADLLDEMLDEGHGHH